MISDKGEGGVSQFLIFFLTREEGGPANFWFCMTMGGTGVHPCSCKSQSLPAPDTHLTNTDSRTPCHTCMTRWVGRGGVGIRCFSNIQIRITRPSVYKKSRQYVFEKNMVMFTPNSDQFRGIWGPPSENKNESWHKTDCYNVLSDYCQEAHSAI